MKMAGTKPSSNELSLWIWLSCSCGVGSDAVDILMETYGDDVRAIYRATQQQYESLGISPAIVLALCNKDLSRTEQILHYCHQNAVTVLCYTDPRFPTRLKDVRPRCILLYCKGTLIDFDRQVCLAMVGTRYMSNYGRRTAYILSFDLAKGGAIVVSGMAKGVDGVCHRGALDASCPTVAVLGCGIDRAYPPFHRELMNEIFRSGLVVTEFAPFTPPLGTNFPIRNRIMSGLCQGTVVIEGDRQSGALITAHHAMYQGRDLFAVPGQIGEANSDGTNQLIKTGARLITNAKEILEEYELLYPHCIHIDKIPNYIPDHLRKGVLDRPIVLRPTKPNATYDKRRQAQPKQPSSKILSKELPPTPRQQFAQSTPLPQNDSVHLAGDEKTVFALLERAVSIDCDTICRRTSLPIPSVLTALTLLEIKGLIEALPGGLYRRK